MQTEKATEPAKFDGELLTIRGLGALLLTAGAVSAFAIFTGPPKGAIAGGVVLACHYISGAWAIFGGAHALFGTAFFEPD